MTVTSSDRAPGTPSRTVLVVGATSAIAERLAALYAAPGTRLVLAARHTAALHAVAQNLRIRYGVEVDEVPLDAAVPASVEAASARIRSGPVPDVTVFAIGANGALDAPEDAAEVTRVTVVNYGAVTQVVAAILPRLRSRTGAAVAVLSSVAGDRGRKANFVYGAAKAALNAYAQGLRGLLHPHVSVTTVKLGYVDSRMSYGLTPPVLTASPEAAALRIQRSIVARRNVVYVPGFWRWVMLLVRLIPEGIFKRMNL